MASTVDCPLRLPVAAYLAILEPINWHRQHVSASLQYDPLWQPLYVVCPTDRQTVVIAATIARRKLGEQQQQQHDPSHMLNGPPHAMFINCRGSSCCRPIGAEMAVDLAERRPSLAVKRRVRHTGRRCGHDGLSGVVVVVRLS